MNQPSNQVYNISPAHIHLRTTHVTNVKYNYNIYALIWYIPIIFQAAQFVFGNLAG